MSQASGRNSNGPTPDLARQPTYATAAWLFLRLLALVYLAAFGSLMVQVLGLIGHDGILPAATFLTAVRRYSDLQQLGLRRFQLVPTVLWLGAGQGGSREDNRYYEPEASI